MAKLKVYSIRNRYGVTSIVAAPNKGAACEAMGVTGGARSEVETIVPIDPGDAEVYDLAMATPGASWTRESGWCQGVAGPWRCSDELAGAKAIVQMRFPAAVAMSDEDGPGKGIWVGDFGRAIGSGPTESAAWLDAARILSIDPPPGLPDNAIVVWVEDDAPEVFRSLRTEGALFYAWVPDGKVDDRFVRMGFLAGSRVERYPVRGGEVWIGVG